MNVGAKQLNPIFQPFALTIEFASLEEVKQFYALFSAEEVRKVTRAINHQAIERVIDTAVVGQVDEGANECYRIRQELAGLFR